MLPHVADEPEKSAHSHVRQEVSKHTVRVFTYSLSAADVILRRSLTASVSASTIIHCLSSTPRIKLDDNQQCLNHHCKVHSLSILSSKLVHQLPLSLFPTICFWDPSLPMLRDHSPASLFSACLGSNVQKSLSSCGATIATRPGRY